MKHLLIDTFGIYDKNCNKINDNKIKNINGLIDKYGFEYSDIVNIKCLIGKSLLSLSPSQTKISYKNEETFLLLNLNKIHSSISLPNEYMVAVSVDGLNWSTPIGDSILTTECNINLTTTNMSNMTDNEKEEYSKIKKFINKNAKLVNKINIETKFIIIKLNSNKLDIINSIMKPKNFITKNSVIPISYTNDSITVTNNIYPFIYKLIIRINKDTYIKNTLEEFK